MSGKWKISIDTGGTFTDCVATSPEGKTEYLKVLSSGKIGGKILSIRNKNSILLDINIKVTKQLFKSYTCQIPSINWQSIIIENDSAGNYILAESIPADTNLGNSMVYLTASEEAPILIARMATGTMLHHRLPEMDFRLGTTKGTNALLEKKGSDTLLVVTRGFRDLLEIGTQQRPDLFSLNIIKPKQLTKVVLEIDESTSSSGTIEQEITEAQMTKCIDAIKKSGCSSIALSLKNSYQNQANEEKLAKSLATIGSINHITSSAQLYPSIKYLTRTETAVVNAYLTPVLSNFLESIAKNVDKEAIRIMTSAGALSKFENFNAKDSLLSGPSGGIIGAAAAANRAGFDKVLTIDMGGTSTDVARYNNGFDYTSELTVGDAHIFTQSLAIETVAAGGGSVCYINEARLQVGPESAGASPGPACYGNNGPLTVTDLNLLSNRLDPLAFGAPLSTSAAEQKLSSIMDQLEGDHLSENRDDLILGFLSIANQKMADAVKKTSIAKGFDPKEYALLGFGGAIGQHICDIADLLEIKDIIVPFNGSLLSAVGISKARIEKNEIVQVLAPLENKKILESSLKKIEHSALEYLISDGIEHPQITSRKVLLRLIGQDTSIEVDYIIYRDLAASFKRKYIELYGHWVEREIEVEYVKVTAAETKQESPLSNENKIKSKKLECTGTREILFATGWESADLYDWPEFIDSSHDITGPAVLFNPFTSIIINPNWNVQVSDGHIIIRRSGDPNKKPVKKNSETVELSLFSNRFKSVAEQMGSILQRTALSVNIKERLDFSCALLDKDGRLVVNAPHIPVHLGSLGICTRSVINKLQLKRGDIAITNHPAFGGSHLPDVSLIAPIYSEEVLVGYLANRAHHAEIGGKAPGSMPADAKNLEEEGVVISPMLLISDGVANWDQIKKLLLDAPYPSRSVDDNLADFQAAVASIIEGQKVMSEMILAFGSETVIHYMKSLSSLASNKLNAKLKELNFKELEATEYLDDNSKITVKITRKDKLIFDFSKTSLTNSGNLNATEAIVNGAVIYVLKLLIGGDIPLNEGLMKDVELRIPLGSLLSPHFSDKFEECPAVVGGNTEVSQRLVDTLLKAFELAACSQGTMNNFLFGDDSYGYYETICGGTGAGLGFHGTDAVHQHMTNTQITDPEILEFRYPVKVKKFEIREKSGGNGKWLGGNGVVREFEFTQPVTITFLTQHRTQKPYGLHGGEAGAVGDQYYINKNGKEIKLDGIGTYQIKKGESVTLLTPGGGGYGEVD